MPVGLFQNVMPASESARGWHGRIERFITITSGPREERDGGVSALIWMEREAGNFFALVGQKSPSGKSPAEPQRRRITASPLQDQVNQQHGDNNLNLAEAELAEAERELGKAERDIENAEHDIKKALEQEEHPHQFEVTVLYNGVAKEFEVRRSELVQRLLDQARQAFGPINNPHLVGLFNTDGIELKDDQSIEAAGVKPHDKLLLRPSTVRGG